MPVSPQFNRRLAAVGTALALVILPISGTLTSAPVLAQPTPSTDSAASADAGAGVTGSEAATDSTGGSDSSSEGAADGGHQPGADNSVEGGDDEEPTADDACMSPGGDMSPEEDKSPPPKDAPCKPVAKLTAHWDPVTKQLSLDPPEGKRGDMPRSWEGVVFNGPQQQFRVPAQNSSSADSTQTRTADGTEPEGATDDSGNPLPSPQADVPTRFFLNAGGKVVAEGQDEPMKFEHFTTDPNWVFDANGEAITVVGDEYKAPDGSADADGSSSASADSTAGSEGAKDGDPAASEDAEASGSAESNRNATSDASASSDSSASANADVSSNSNSNSNSSSNSNSNSSSNSTASSEAGGEDGADNDASGEKDSTGASDSSDSEGSKDSDGGSTGSDEDGERDKNGAGTVTGDDRADPDDSTPDPATGNGGRDGRQTIPGTAGDDWLPGGEASQRPDYSDPVPSNPDSPAREDDTDLITGGDTPSPRANTPPSTSFGESIVSTIVSSWPVFVLAASGMAAVGFIIYLMGRRGKQS